MPHRKPPLMHSGMARVREITQFYLPPTFIHEWNEPSCLYSVSIHQMAPPERGNAHPITAHYSFIDLERMKGWVGLDRLWCPSVDMDASATSTACCGLHLWPPKSNQVIGGGYKIFPVNVIQTAQVVREIWFSQVLTSMALNLTFDLQHLIRSSIGG